MIDLNDVDELAPLNFDLDEIRDRLRNQAAQIYPGLFRDAAMSRDKRSLRCADLSGRAPRNEGSCIIHLAGPHAGTGHDFATNEHAGPIDLVEYATGLTGFAVFQECARLVGLDPARPAPKWQARPEAKPAGPRDVSLDIARIKADCEPLAGTRGETYLAGRGLKDPASPDLLFHPDLTDFETRRGYFGIVATIRNGAGEPTGGIHRTFLTDDGTGKAPPGRKMLGPVAGGSVRLWPILDGSLGIAEGIETALAVMQIFPGVSCWAALSADNISRWEWPRGVEEVTIFRDAGEPGEKAAATLAGRLVAAGIRCRIVAPLRGDDFNDDLRHGATAADYEPVDAGPQQSKPAAGDAPTSVADLVAAASSLTKPPDNDRLRILIGAMATMELEPLDQRQIFDAMKRAAGINVDALRDQIRVARQRSADGDPVAPPWAKRLRRDVFQQLERNEANVITAFSNDPAFAGAIVFDEFRQECMLYRPLPWSKRESVPRPWTDVDDIRAAEWLQRTGLNVTPAVASRGVQAVAREITIHPVRDYLASLRWDGVNRIENWVVDFLGAEDTKLNRTFGALWMISAVARVMKPGTKADHLLILEGPQGAKKSTALKTLAGAEFFTDELAEVGSKDASQQVRSVWVIEIAELDAFSRSEVSRIKAFLTRTTDRFRPPYGRYVVNVDRQCIFAGTVNHETYLRDETGNRRFWPVRCGEIDIDGLRLARDQLWAEAVDRFKAGAIWWLTDTDLIGEAREEQEARREPDAWDEKINFWLLNDSSFRRPNPLRDVSVSEILQQAIGLEPGRWTRADQMRVSAYLKRGHWERYYSGSGVHRVWRYRR